MPEARVGVGEAEPTDLDLVHDALDAETVEVLHEMFPSLRGILAEAFARPFEDEEGEDAWEPDHIDEGYMRPAKRCARWLEVAKKDKEKGRRGKGKKAAAAGGGKGVKEGEGGEEESKMEVAEQEEEDTLQDGGVEDMKVG